MEIIYAGSSSPTLVISIASTTFNYVNFLVVIAVSVINFFFSVISGPLTGLEKHRTWSKYRKHNCLKLISFKMVNLLSLYAANEVALVSNQNITGTGDNICFYHTTGSKFLVMILVDIAVFNGVGFGIPLVQAFLRNHIPSMKKTTGSDDSLKPEFDIAQEYLEIFYRQFIIYLGMTVFPALAVLGFIANIIEYPLHRLRMLRVCQRPKRLDLSMKRFLLFWLIIIALAATFAPPQGAFWVMWVSKDFRSIFNCCEVLTGPATTTVCNATFISY